MFETFLFLSRITYHEARGGMTMLKKILKSILGSKSHHQKYSHSSSAWKKMNKNKHKHLGHQHYKKKHKSGSFFSSFFSS